MNAEPMQSDVYEDDSDHFVPRPLYRRLVRLYTVLLILLLLALVPPLVKLGRYRHGVVQAIGKSLGRPVQVDDVSLIVLPVPGLKLQNFVVFEDPAFGSEPVMRAETVTARLRISSLWRRQVEVSRIVLEAPSINLVHLSDGRWNVDSIFLQASHVESAPTTQAKAGPAPRFPYIETTGARLNLKMDQHKMPLSLTDADLALWQPEPGQWRVRVKAHPLRTSTTASDAGLITAEATLGRAATFATIPLNLHADWRDAPLGEASRIATGEDMGWRGTLDWSADIQGTFGENAVATHLELHDLRRADFVPAHLQSVTADCKAHAGTSFHALRDVICLLPQDDAGHALKLTVTAPEITRPASWEIAVESSGVPVQSVLDWTGLLTPHATRALHGTGAFTGSLQLTRDERGQSARWIGDLQAESATVTEEGVTEPLFKGALALKAGDADGIISPATTAPSSLPPLVLALEPIDLNLGSGESSARLRGAYASNYGYQLHLNGTATWLVLQRLGEALPPFGENLKSELVRSGELPADDAPKAVAGVPTPPATTKPATIPPETPLALSVDGDGAWGSPFEWHTATPVAKAAPKGHPHHRH